jgi:hypothetical protein
MSTSLTTKANPYRRVLASNTTASAFTARVDLLTMPAAPAGESTTGYIYVNDSNTVLIKLYGTDAEGANDASHATDLGFMRQADVFEPVLRAALK